MKNFNNSEDPLLVIILKSISLLSAMGAVVYLAKAMLGGTLANDANEYMAAKVAFEHATNFSHAMTAAGAAISFWWMGSVLALLNRIANNSEKPVPEAVDRVSSSPQAVVKSKPSRRLDDDLSTPPKYEL
jgi:hypothetical protein